MARRGLTLAAGYGGIAAAAGGLYLLLADHALPAGACIALGLALLWLRGTWVLPWTRDGYLRRVQEVTWRWRQNAQWARDVSSRRRAKLRGELRRLAPPPGGESEHERLVALVPEDEASAPFDVRVANAIAVLAQLDDAAARARATADTTAGRRYARGLEVIVERGRSSSDAEAARAEEASHAAALALARMKPPASARDEHGRVAEAFREYLAAVQLFRGACAGHDAPRAGAAARGLASAQNELQAALVALAERLDYAARWPVARPS